MICIIPARGGSKRLPGKNLLKLDGEYIINRVIQIATDSDLFTNIIVSTDSEEIADIVKGAAVSMRPEQIAGDIAEDKVLRWTAYKYNSAEFCRIYPFAVLLTPKRLKEGYREYNQPNYEAVLECQEYTHSVFRCFTLSEGYKHPKVVSVPTEALPTRYHDAGTYMFTHVDVLESPLEERNIRWLPVKQWEAQDIDTIDDWRCLEMKWRYR
jgi:N-acylneuraminate cytidylyltransferase